MLMYFLLAVLAGNSGSDVPHRLIVTGEGADLTVRFDFATSDKISQSHLAWVGRQSMIGFLDLAYSQVTERELKFILERVDVRGIGLGKNRLSAKALKRLAREEEISVIHMSGSGIPADDLRELKACKKLKDLWIGSPEWKARIDTPSIHAIPSLRKLTITAKSISDDEIRKLGTITRLSELTLFLVEHRDGILKELQAALPDTLVFVHPKRDGPFGWEEGTRAATEVT